MWGPIIATGVVVELVLVAVVVRLCSGAANRRGATPAADSADHRRHIAEKPDKNANGIKPKQNGVGTNKVIVKL